MVLLQGIFVMIMFCLVYQQNLEEIDSNIDLCPERLGNLLNDIEVNSFVDEGSEVAYGYIYGTSTKIQRIDH